MHKIKVAVIGAGNMGRNHLRTYSTMPEVELVALADIDASARKLADEYRIRHYKDYVDLLEAERPDAVSVVVPTTLHYEFGTEILNRKINCLMEKPIASTPGEAEKLIRLARKKGVIFSVGHIERYNPMVQKLKKLISKKELGEVTSIVVRRVGGFPSTEPKTDVIIDLAVHDIDVINYLLKAKPKRVYGHGSRTLHTTKIDSAEIFLDYGNASGFIQANWITPVKIRTIAVTGTDGYVEGNYITQELTYYQNNLRRVGSGFKNFVVALGEPEKRFVSKTPQEPLRNELKEFIESIHKKQETSLLVSPDDAKLALDIALKALGKSDKGHK